MELDKPGGHGEAAALIAGGDDRVRGKGLQSCDNDTSLFFSRLLLPFKPLNEYLFKSIML